MLRACNSNSLQGPELSLQKEARLEHAEPWMEKIKPSRCPASV